MLTILLNLGSFLNIVSINEEQCYTFIPVNETLLENYTVYAISSPNTEINELTTHLLLTAWN